jgi:hypothetical protein
MTFYGCDSRDWPVIIDHPDTIHSETYRLWIGYEMPKWPDLSPTVFRDLTPRVASSSVPYFHFRSRKKIEVIAGHNRQAERAEQDLLLPGAQTPTDKRRV